MKKLLLIVSLIIISLGCIACGKTPNISYAREQIQINFDENYTIEEDDIKIENTNSDYVITIQNSDVAELDDMTIIPKNEGETYIRFALEDEDIYVDIPLIVTHIIFASDASIANNEVVININNTEDVYNPITLNEGCNETPQISYDRNVISYNYITGKIVPRGVGSTTVLVLFNSCNVSFNVIVVDKVFTSALEIESHVVYVGDTGMFEFNLFPTLANTYRFYCFSNKIQVNNDGSYTAISEGNVDVYVEYYVDETTPVVKTFQVNIVSEIKSFDYEVRNIDNSAISYLLKEKQYKIVILNIQNVKQEDISFSNNFEINKVDIFETYIEIKGAFKDAGDQSLNIEISSNGNVVGCHKNYTIYCVDDIKVVAKWSAYVQQPSTDGKYYIKLEPNTNFPSYLRFYLTVGGMSINEEFDVFDITTTKQEVSNIFQPIVVGEFIFRFEFMGHKVGEIVVVVE